MLGVKPPERIVRQPESDTPDLQLTPPRPRPQPEAP